MEAEDQLKEVQSVLDRLTRFRYVNGWAAVAAGVLSIIAYIFICIQYHVPWVVDKGGEWSTVTLSQLVGYSAIIGGLLLVAGTVCGAIILLSLPNDLTGAAWRNLMRLIAVFALYIICGASVLWAVMSGTGEFNLGILRAIPPMMCIFYGLAHIHASHISLPSLKLLGFGMLICGIIGCALPDLGWFFWGVGFGAFHILYGLYIVKSNRN